MAEAAKTGAPVALVTGGGTGIGAACCRALAAEGLRVAVHYRGSQAPALALAESLGDAFAVRADLADPVEIDALIAAIRDRAGRVDVLVNNAGYNCRGAVEETPCDELERIIDVNLKAPIRLTRQALPYLRRARKGAIVNVASIAGCIPLPFEATYSATKFGLRAFTFALAEELESTGITVSAVSPGPVATQFILREIAEVPDIVFSQPMSTAEEVAALVLDCAADGALERTCPQLSGYMATVGYLIPQLPRLLRPLLEYQGRVAKERYVKDHAARKR